VKIVEDVLRLRLGQIIVNEEYKAGKFKGPVHLALGHEAIAVALDHVVQESDKLVLSHRNMEYNLARLGKLRPVLEEYFLNPGGLAGGKLGSMNLINPARGIIYSSSILGNNFSVSAGIAMAEKISGRLGVTFVLGGDGSIEEGSFYESLTMMKTFGVSAIILIENNGWSLGTHISERRCPIDLEKLVSSISIPYMRLEGNKVQEYIDTLRVARERVVAEEVPICVEVIVKTLGDRRALPTPEYPEGKYINYHAGPTPAVDVAKHIPGGVLQEDAEDPVFVIRQVIGNERLIELSNEIMKELQDEIR